MALALRIYGINWDSGFPYTPHPDERAILMKVGELDFPSVRRLDSLLDTNDSPLNPHWFNYGTFPMYLLKSIEGFYESVSRTTVSDLRWLARVLSAVADTAILVAVFGICRRAYGPGTALIASAFVGIAVIHIQLSHFFAFDTFITLFSTASLYFLYRTARTGEKRYSIIAGLLIGLGLASKISLLPIFAAFFMAHLMYVLVPNSETANEAAISVETRASKATKSLLSGLAIVILIFFIAQPYAFLDWSQFVRDMSEQSEMIRRIRDYPYTRQYTDTTPYLYQIIQLAKWGLGWPLGAIAWLGLLYVSIRGLPIRYAAGYLALGWILPASILIYFNSFPLILAAASMSLVALAATLPIRREDTVADVLLLSWIAPYLLIMGSFEVKFYRYLLPAVPILLIFGARMITDTWNITSAKASWSRLRPVLLLGIASLLLVTALYSVSYLNIYSKDHTAVRSAEWFNRNTGQGSIILKEHWEEGLPDLENHQVRELPMYEADSLVKARVLASELSKADFLYLFSNRMYGTLPRMEKRYPMSRGYYESLFAGELGYELVNVESSYPSIFGITFFEETFQRAKLPDPTKSLDSEKPSSVALNLGFADESFSVYDHPKVMIFQNLGRFPAELLREKIQSYWKTSQIPKDPATSESTGLMMDHELSHAQRLGGTWTEIVKVDSWTNRLPVLSWLAMVEGMAFLVFPLAFWIFRPLADRGFLFSKILGLLLVCGVVWLLASYKVIAFSATSVTITVMLLGFVSILLVQRQKRMLIQYVKTKWKMILIFELLFLTAFFAFLAIRMANPDLWHPARGGEKPMDLAYLNSVLKSSYMPPYDPWFSGGYLNYYYWGQFIVATLIRATGIIPDIAFNLSIPLFFALTFVGAFAVVYNLAALTLRSLNIDGQKASMTPYAAGLCGAVFVTLLGNMDGAIQLLSNLAQTVLHGVPFSEFDFWRSSRMMPPDPPGHEITEFPFFTFLFGDLHAHLMSLPFTLLSLGLCIALLAGRNLQYNRRPTAVATEVVRLGVLGLTVGSLRLLNTWDYPTYLFIAVGTIFLGEILNNGGANLFCLSRAGIKSLLVMTIGYVAFLPYHMTTEVFFKSVEPTTNTTVLWQFLAINGLFVFVVATFYGAEAKSWVNKVASRLKSVFSAIIYTTSTPNNTIRDHDIRISVKNVVTFIVCALTFGYIMTASFSGTVGSTLPFATSVLFLVFVYMLRCLDNLKPDSGFLLFVSLLVISALALVIGLDIFRVTGDIDRMNSVFKFYLQIWVLLGLGSAYLLWHLIVIKGYARQHRTNAMRLWLTCVAILIACSSVYTVMGTHDRLRDRFDGNVTSLTLDGTAYMQKAVYHDEKGAIDLAHDLDAITWLRKNVQGSPVIVEGITPNYRWGSRVSVYTGLPSVVGWKWHQEQQRWDYRDEVARRINDVNTIYNTPDVLEAITLLTKYDVEYIYVGQVELNYYSSRGIKKFDEGLGGHLDRLYMNDKTTIYRVNQN